MKRSWTFWFSDLFVYTQQFKEVSEVCARGNICQQNLEEGELLYQKAQKKFRAPGENRTHDPLSSSSDALTIELLEAPVADPGEGPLLFQNKLRPQGPKKILWDRPRLLIWRSGSATVLYGEQGTQKGGGGKVDERGTLSVKNGI